MKIEEALRSEDREVARKAFAVLRDKLGLSLSEILHIYKGNPRHEESMGR